MRKNKNEAKGLAEFVTHTRHHLPIPALLLSRHSCVRTPAWRGSSWSRGGLSWRHDRSHQACHRHLRQFPASNGASHRGLFGSLTWGFRFSWWASYYYCYFFLPFFLFFFFLPQPVPPQRGKIAGGIETRRRAKMRGNISETDGGKAMKIILSAQRPFHHKNK